MKFALITKDSAHGVYFKINPETGDGTAFMNWVDVWKGLHFSYEKLGPGEDLSFLKSFDVVMFSAHLAHIADLIRIARYLKDSETVTIFYPEGSTQLYESGICGFQPLYFEAFNACDILSSAEEDKIKYYENFIQGETLVKFIHVPMTEQMAAGEFFRIRESKDQTKVAVYGDNNPNHPLIALGVINKLRSQQQIPFEAIAIECRGADFGPIFPGLKIYQTGKQGLNSFLRMLGRTFFHIYPTEWIGTARQQISCAVTGTPCIGNRDSHTQRRLFPELGVEIHDVRSMQRLASKLIHDRDFYNGVVKYAWDNVQFYNLENTKHRFLSAVEHVKFIRNEKATA